MYSNVNSISCPLGQCNNYWRHCWLFVVRRCVSRTRIFRKPVRAKISLGMFIPRESPISPRVSRNFFRRQMFRLRVNRTLYSTSTPEPLRPYVPYSARDAQPVPVSLWYAALRWHLSPALGVPLSPVATNYTLFPVRNLCGACHSSSSISVSSVVRSEVPVLHQFRYATESSFSTKNECFTDYLRLPSTPSRRDTHDT